MKAALLLLTLIASANALAATGERYEFYNGIRQMGMGGATVATVNDETALLANPAALGKLRDYFITLVDPELEVGVDTQKIIGYDILAAGNPQKVLDKANLHPDLHLHSRGQVFPSVVVPNFGVGLFFKQTVDSEVDSAANVFKYNYTSDAALVFGFNFRFWNGIVKIGTNVRMDNHTIVRNNAIDPTSTTLTLATLADSGLGVANDSGIILAAPIAWIPTLAAVYHDTGNTAYNMREGMFLKTTNRPAATPATLDAAIAIHPILGNRFRSTWTAEYQDALNVDKEKDYMRRVHAGVEVNFADALFLRGGMNQRYWTAGLELSMMNYQFQAASYGEDIGPDLTPREDRRYEVKFAFRF